MLFVIFFSFLCSSTQAQTQSFKEFAKEFTEYGILSLKNFKSFCENKIQSIDGEGSGNPIKEKPSESYSYLKYFFKINKYKIKKNKIDYSDDEVTITIYFRKNADGEWKLYKLDPIM